MGLNTNSRKSQNGSDFVSGEHPNGKIFLRAVRVNTELFRERKNMSNTVLQLE